MRRVPPTASAKAASLHLDALSDQRALLGGRADVIFDIGAHVGQTAEQYRRAFPQATVYSFEPFPESFQEVRRVAEKDPKITGFEVAVGDRSGRQKLYYTDFSPMNSLLRLQPSSTEFLKEAKPQELRSREVDIITLDEFCAAQDIETIDICKMDVQGAELRALQGATRLLAGGHIKLIFLEVNFNPYYEGQASFAQVYELLYSYGFSLFGLYGMNHGKKNLLLTESDAIFIGKSISEKMDF
jgi:FkbM family methyltransferase